MRARPGLQLLALDAPVLESVEAIPGARELVAVLRRQRRERQQRDELDARLTAFEVLSTGTGRGHAASLAVGALRI